MLYEARLLFITISDIKLVTVQVHLFKNKFFGSKINFSFCVYFNYVFYRYVAKYLLVCAFKFGFLCKLKFTLETKVGLYFYFLYSILYGLN